jgi:hypothetical protein
MKNDHAADLTNERYVVEIDGNAKFEFPIAQACGGDA